MKSQNPARIMIAEDHPLFSKALRDLIQSDNSLILVGESGNGKQVLQLVEQLKPDLLLLDLNMPGMGGIEIIQELHHRGLETHIIVLTMNKEEEIFNSVMDAGVSGYVLKESAVDVILESIREVLDGGSYISPSLSYLLVERRNRAKVFSNEHPSLADLTPAERKILKLISENMMSKEIAARLSVSEKTVENHRMNISNKLNLHGSNSLLKFAIEHRTAIALL